MAAKPEYRVACYIDGFNLYHAVHNLQRPHLKWCNLWQLAESACRTRERLVAVNYFSAFATWRPAAYARHRLYVSALQSVGVTVTMAHFKEKPRQCNSCRRQWIDHEEKETDVRLALGILADAEDDVFDRAIVVSADSDLVPAVELVKRRHPGKSVAIAVPPGMYGRGRHLQAVSDSYFELRASRLERTLLPQRIPWESAEIVRPSEYDPGR